MDIISRNNLHTKQKHLEICKRCSKLYNNSFCTVWQKDISETNTACDGTEDTLEALM